MISLSVGSRIWLVASVTDMRNGFNGLTSKVQNTLRDDRFSGHLFIIRGHHRDMIKILWAGLHGLCLFTKRLERGTLPSDRYFMPDLRRKMLFTALWNICARISEALTWGRLSASSAISVHQLAILKQREEKGETPDRRCRAHRLVPLSDAQYVTQMKMMIVTMCTPLERRSEIAGRTDRLCLWEITDRTTRTWLNEEVETAASEGRHQQCCYQSSCCCLTNE